MNTIGGNNGREQSPRVETPEVSVEIQEQGKVEEVREKQKTRDQQPVKEQVSVGAAFQQVAPLVQQTKDPVLKRVEKILEDGMGDAYASLSPSEKVKFKKRGEEIAVIIQKMVVSAKVQAKKVIRLIVSWLRIIPHVNRFFLEQEAKIKTDQIISFSEKNKHT